jgi:hypothetical protein
MKLRGSIVEWSYGLNMLDQSFEVTARVLCDRFGRIGITLPRATPKEMGEIAEALFHHGEVIITIEKAS